MRLRAGDEPVEIDAQADGAGWRLRMGARELRGSAALADDGGLEVELDGAALRAREWSALGDQLHLFTPSAAAGCSGSIRWRSPRRRTSSAMC